MRRLDVSVRAKREIDDILLTSEERHGPRTAQRYRELFAFDELVADPSAHRHAPPGGGACDSISCARQPKGWDRPVV